MLKQIEDSIKHQKTKSQFTSNHNQLHSYLNGPCTQDSNLNKIRQKLKVSKNLRSTKPTMTISTLTSHNNEFDVYKEQKYESLEMDCELQKQQIAYLKRVNKIQEEEIEKLRKLLKKCKIIDQKQSLKTPPKINTKQRTSNGRRIITQIYDVQTKYKSPNKKKMKGQ